MTQSNYEKYLALQLGRAKISKAGDRVKIMYTSSQGDNLEAMGTIVQGASDMQKTNTDDVAFYWISVKYVENRTEKTSIFSSRHLIF